MLPKPQYKTQIEKLLRCPFCGHKAQIAQKGTIHKQMIICCSTCSCMLKTGEIFGLTTNLEWNRRVKS